MALRHVLSGACAVVLLLGALTACTPEPIVGIPTAAPGAVSLIVGTPQVPDGVNPQEGALLANVYAAALNAAGVKASVKTANETQGPLMSALQLGSVDIVPVYSREALADLAPSLTAESPADVVESLKTSLPAQVGILDAAKAEVSDAVVVTAVTAQKYQLKSISDLGKVCDELTMGGSAAFKRDDRGLAGLGSDYNCVPKAYLPLAHNEQPNKDSVVWSLLSDTIQMAELYLSSPAIEDNSLVVLTDSKELFLDQNIVPLVAAKKVPEQVQAVLNKVSAALTSQELSNLNRLSQDPQFGGLANVATAWLVQQGLIKASS
ncbi:ABC transporter substrate-binding protein [Arthrobacter sp. HLT1-20]